MIRKNNLIRLDHGSSDFLIFMKVLFMLTFCGVFIAIIVYLFSEIVFLKKDIESFKNIVVSQKKELYELDLELHNLKKDLAVVNLNNGPSLFSFLSSPEFLKWLGYCSLTVLIVGGAYRTINLSWSKLEKLCNPLISIFTLWFDNPVKPYDKVDPFDPAVVEKTKELYKKVLGK